MRKTQPQDSIVIRKLRKKFVIVTMCLMIGTLAVLIFFDYINTMYWAQNSTIYSLEGYVKDDSLYETDNMVIMDYYGEPVYIATLDENKNVTDMKSSTGETLAPEVVDNIVNSGHRKYKWNSYAYVLDQQGDGYRLAVINTADGSAKIYRKIVDVLQIILTLFVIFIISLLLSRFVTKPAHIALAREKQFISDASHELKTPLSAISINAQALQPEVGDNKHLQNIVAEAKRMDELIKNLLKLSYMDEIGIHIEKQMFDLSQCCSEIVLSMESAVYEKSIALDYDIDDNISFTGNEVHIKQVVVILLDNAMKHTPAEGNISFNLKTKGNKIIITVSNSGQGISPEVLPHIFDRFYRADEARQVSSGDISDTYADASSNNYGLGLAIAKSIVEAHSGKITALSEYGNGATLTVELPVTQPDKDKRK